MPADVVVYRGLTGHVGIFANVLGTDYTFEITGIPQPELFSGSNAFVQLGEGFVYRGENTSGSADTLVYSDGGGATVLARDINGNLVDTPHDLGSFAGEAVFLARTASVGGSNSGSGTALMTTHGLGPLEPLLPVKVDSYVIVGDALYALATNGDIHRVGPDHVDTLVYDARIGDTGPNNPAQYLFEMDGAVYFWATNNAGNIPNDFFRIDPTTGLVTRQDIAPGSANPLTFDTAVGAHQFFFWNYAPSTGIELYVSDGTGAGTHLVKDIRPGTGSSVVDSSTILPVTCGDSLFFLVTDGVHGRQLWTSDGTEAGTFALTGEGTPVGVLGVGTNLYRAITVGDEVFFAASRADVGIELFATDGTLGGTRLVADINPGSSSARPDNFHTDGSRLYFSIGSGTDDDSVWVSDGTAAGTHVLSDPDPDGSTFNPPDMIAGLRLDLDNLPPRIITGTSGDDTLTGDFFDETIQGLAGDDHLFGNAGFDTLIGGAGNDILDGGTNPSGQGDIMLGGAGDDTYYVDSPLDLVDEGFVFPDAGWGGTDTVVSTANWYWDSQSVGEIDRIAEDASDPTGAGVTFVGGIFDNVLYGHSGTDILFGRGGNDVYRAGDGVDWISLSTLGLTDDNAYAGVDGHNTVIVDPRASGKFSYDIIFEFDPGKDKVDVSAYGSQYASGADVLSHASDDGAGSSFIALGDGLDYLYFVGLTKAELNAGDFVV